MTDENLARENGELRQRLAQADRDRDAVISEREHGWRWKTFGEKAVAAGLPEVFDRFSREIAEGGWDAVLKKWTREVPPSPRSGQSAAGSTWTVIPGVGGGCRETVIVFLDDEHPEFHMRYMGHGGAIEALLRHLVECQAVRRVMILTNQYHGTGFKRGMLPWIRAWENRGIAFAVGLVGPDDHNLVPLNVGS